MNIMTGQYKDVTKAFGFIPKENCSIVFEGGSDNGESFNGSFLVRIKRKGVYRFDDGKMIKRVK
ncbi:hypothetical protein CVD28_01935 [Bacillus sp. M6-12]|uniref:hypothetical protein n=1 Tax=Bacillus sp. M6-12 TaxID=2054166 RepID=UPI000C778C9E|nr:hypothetical protein [Bacillus sp. M6-12]PLS19192.1 hypothetical protein CVD28_01935 [Bacillus sp. M6-12]